MKKQLFRLYNQNLDEFTRSFCSGYSIFHVIQINYGLKFNNDYIVLAAKSAHSNGVYILGVGAYYSKMYKFFQDKIKDIYDIETTIVKKSVYSNDFKKLLKQGYAFSIGLKYAGLWWRGARKDQKILIEEAQKKVGSEYGHALTYFFSKVTGEYYIIDSLGTSRKPVEMDIETLRTACDTGIFFVNARTIVTSNSLLDKHLRHFKEGKEVKNVERLPIGEQEAVAKAALIRHKVKGIIQ